MAKKSNQETRKLKEVKTVIAQAETHKTALKQRLRDISDYVLIQGLDAELQKLNANLEQDLERWARLAE